MYVIKPPTQHIYVNLQQINMLFTQARTFVPILCTNVWTGLALGQPPLPRRWLLLLLLKEEKDGSSIWTPSPHRSPLLRMLVPVLVAVGVGGMIPPSDDDGGGEPPRTDEATIVSSSSLLVLSLRIAPFFVFLGAVPPAPAGALVCGPVRLGGCLLLLPFAALALALDLVLALDLALLVLLDLEAGFLIMMEDNEWRGVSLLEYWLLVGPRTCLDLLVSILVMCRWVRRVGVRVSTKLIQKQRGAGRFGRQMWSQKYAFDGQGACSTGEVVKCLVTTRPADTAAGYARK